MSKEYMDYNPEEEFKIPNKEGYATEDRGVQQPTVAVPDDASVGIIKAMSPLQTLTRIRMNMKGKFWDEEKKEYVQVEGFKPVLNDYGISKYLLILSSVLNDTLTFSSIPDLEFGKKLVQHVYEETVPVMYIYHEEWGIKNKGHLPILANNIFMMTIGAVFKAVGAGDRNLVRGAVTEQIHGQSAIPQQQKQGVLSKLNPFSKR